MVTCQRTRNVHIINIFVYLFSGFVKAMKECEVHKKLLEEMESQEPMSDGEGHSDVGDEVCNYI